MSNILLKWFGGMVPRIDEQNLDPEHATQSDNVNLYSGELRPILQPQLAHEFCQPGDECYRLPGDPVEPPSRPPEPEPCVPVVIETDLTTPILGAVGDTLSLSITVNADATGPLQYRWFVNTLLIEDQTGPTFTYGPLTVDDNLATIEVYVVGPCGDALSSPAQLLIEDCPPYDPCEPFQCNAVLTFLTGIPHGWPCDDPEVFTNTADNGLVMRKLGTNATVQLSTPKFDGNTPSSFDWTSSGFTFDIPTSVDWTTCSSNTETYFRMLSSDPSNVEFYGGEVDVALVDMNSEMASSMAAISTGRVTLQRRMFFQINGNPLSNFTDSIYADVQTDGTNGDVDIFFHLSGQIGTGYTKNVSLTTNIDFTKPYTITIVLDIDYSGIGGDMPRSVTVKIDGVGGSLFEGHSAIVAGPVLPTDVISLRTDPSIAQYLRIPAFSNINLLGVTYRDYHRELWLAVQRNGSGYTTPFWCGEEDCEPYSCDAYEQIATPQNSIWPLDDAKFDNTAPPVLWRKVGTSAFVANPHRSDWLFPGFQPVTLNDYIDSCDGTSQDACIGFDAIQNPNLGPISISGFGTNLPLKLRNSVVFNRQAVSSITLGRNNDSAIMRGQWNITVQINSDPPTDYRVDAQVCVSDLDWSMGAQGYSGSPEFINFGQLEEIPKDNRHYYTELTLQLAPDGNNGGDVFMRLQSRLWCNGEYIGQIDMDYGLLGGGISDVSTVTQNAGVQDDYVGLFDTRGTMSFYGAHAADEDAGDLYLAYLRNFSEYTIPSGCARNASSPDCNPACDALNDYAAGSGDFHWPADNPIETDNFLQGTVNLPDAPGSASQTLIGYPLIVGDCGVGSHIDFATAGVSQNAVTDPALKPLFELGPSTRVSFSAVVKSGTVSPSWAFEYVNTLIYEAFLAGGALGDSGKRYQRYQLGMETQGGDQGTFRLAYDSGGGSVFTDGASRVIDGVYAVTMQIDYNLPSNTPNTTDTIPYSTRIRVWVDNERDIDVVWNDAVGGVPASTFPTHTVRFADVTADSLSSTEAVFNVGAGNDWKMNTVLAGPAHTRADYYSAYDRNRINYPVPAGCTQCPEPPTCVPAGGDCEALKTYPSGIQYPVAEWVARDGPTNVPPEVRSIGISPDTATYNTTFSRVTVTDDCFTHALGVGGVTGDFGSFPFARMGYVFLATTGSEMDVNITDNSGHYQPYPNFKLNYGNGNDTLALQSGTGFNYVSGGPITIPANNQQVAVHVQMEHRLETTTSPTRYWPVSIITVTVFGAGSFVAETNGANVGTPDVVATPDPVWRQVIGGGNTDAVIAYIGADVDVDWLNYFGYTRSDYVPPEWCN